MVAATEAVSGAAPLRQRLHEDIERLLAILGASASELGAIAWEARSEEVMRRAFYADAKQLLRTEHSERAGIGVQVYLSDGAAGYAYTSRLDADAARSTAARAIDAARSSLPSALVPAQRATASMIVAEPRVKVHPEDASDDEKIALALRGAQAAQDAAKGALRRVESVWGETYGRRCYLASDGRRARVAPLHATLMISANAKDGARAGAGRGSAAGALGMETLVGSRAPEALGAEAAQRALDDLRAEAMPAGRSPAILDNHLAGVLAHESFGHLSEYDTIYAKWSILHDKHLQRLGPEHVSISDSGIVDPDDPAHGVYVPVDDEGTPGDKVTILDHGILQRFMHNRLTASAQGGGIDSTGNGRCVSVNHPTLVRMRNTFFEPGDWTLDEMVREMKDGFIAGGSTGGQPTADGSFVFRATEGWRVANGEIVAPVKGVVLLGNILQTMPRIVGCSRDFRVHTMFFGGCGKWGQNDLAVGVGGPHLYLNEAHFGGDAA